jgi:hypothetical protein
LVVLTSLGNSFLVNYKHRMLRLLWKNHEELANAFNRIHCWQ